MDRIRVKVRVWVRVQIVVAHFLLTVACACIYNPSHIFLSGLVYIYNLALCKGALTLTLILTITLNPNHNPKLNPNYNPNPNPKPP